MFHWPKQVTWPSIKLMPVEDITCLPPGKKDTCKVAVGGVGGAGDAHNATIPSVENNKKKIKICHTNRSNNKIWQLVT